MKSLRIASLSFLQLLILSNDCNAEKTSETANPLTRMLLARFASSSPKNLGFLRKLAGGSQESTTMKEEFGPGSDWSCTSESNRATDFDSCTLSEASKTVEGGCSWCPLGSVMGVCLRAGQASVINSFENDHLLHLKCYSDSEEVIDDAATAFWDETMDCLPHHRETCGADHFDHFDHGCTYCTTEEPAMGLCLSADLWENLVVAQALEEFDANGSMDDQIPLDQVIHCSTDTESIHGSDKSLWSNPCEGPPIIDAESEENCFIKNGCAVAPNIFPGLLGMKSGHQCVSVAHERATLWALELLEDMGWNKEMDAYRED